MLMKQLKKLDERDFAVLRGPLESGRQSPKTIAGILLLSVFALALFVYLMYLITTDTNFPYKDLIFYVYLAISIVLIIFSIIYSIPAAYKRGQKMQYFISILVSQLIFGLFFLISPLFLLGIERFFRLEESSLVMITFILLTIGLLLFIFTWIRFINLLRKGEYRPDSKKGRLRSRFESKTLIPIAIVVGTSMSLLLQYLFKNMFIFDGNVMLVILVGPLLFYTMVFVLPEQLVILYCKTRFDSFNFDKEGNLKPFSTEVNEANEI